MFENQQLASAYQFAGQDLPWLLRHWAQHRGEKIFLAWEPGSGEDQRWTYAEFWREVSRIAAGLHRRGIGRGDRVLLHSDNCPEMMFAWYACATLGAVAVTTNTGSTADELAHSANHAGVRAAITQPRYAGLVAASVTGLEWLAVMAANSIECADDQPRRGPHDLPTVTFDALRGDPGALPARAAEPLLPVGIVYTSGTTSRPKAVVHTHANFLWAGRLGAYVLDFGPEDVHYAQMPFFHLNAQAWATAVALGAGGSVLLVPQPTVRRFWEVVIKHGVTHMTLMGLVQRTLENEPFPQGHRLKVLQGGVPPEVFARKAGARAIGGYGMSELVSYMLHTDFWQSWPANAVGRPAAGYEAKLVNQDTGELCGPDEDGELWVRGIRGVHLFLEYDNNPEANAKAFTDDGWFKTGDIFRIAGDGIYYFRDRDKDRIKVGGENVSAAEVESVIAQVPGVARTAVVAQPDAKMGDVAVAFVVRTEKATDEDAIRAAVLARCEEKLSRFKRPRAVYFIDGIPQGFLDKTLRSTLRELAISLSDGPD